MAKSYEFDASDLAMRVVFDANSGPQYRVIQARVVGKDGWCKMRYSQGGGWCGVKVKGQTDREHAVANQQDPMYATEPYWDSSDYHLADLKAGVKALEMLDKKLRKIAEEWGPPANFGTHVHRICKVIGIETMILVMDSRIEDSRPVSLVDGVNQINYMIGLWVRQAKESAPFRNDNAA